MKSFWLSIVMFTLIGSTARGRSPFVHVSLAKENRIVTYQLNPRDGGLNEIDSVLVSGGPGALAGLLWP